MLARANNGGAHEEITKTNWQHIKSSGSYPFTFDIPADAKYIVLTDEQKNLNKNCTGTTNFISIASSYFDFTDFGAIGTTAYVKKVTSTGTQTCQNPGASGGNGAARIGYTTNDYISLVAT